MSLIESKKVISDSELPATIQRKPIGSYLVEAALISHSQLEIALKQQKKTGLQLEEILVSNGWIQSQTIEYFMNYVISEERELEQRKSNDWNPYDRGQRSKINPLIQLFWSPVKFFKISIAVIAGLVLLHVIVTSFNLSLRNYPLKESISRLTHLNVEQNLPTFYSTFSLLFCAALLATIAIATKLKRERYFSHWLGLSLLFIFLSFDEFMALHEILIEPTRQLVNVGGVFRYAWVIPGSIAVGLISLAFWKFLFALPSPIRNLFIISGALFVGGGLGLEMLKGYLVDAGDLSSVWIGLLTICEEFLEMLGIAVFIYALLTYISDYQKGITLQIHIGNPRSLNFR